MRPLTTIIDGDSIPYIVAWKYNDNDPNDLERVLDTTDKFVENILNSTGAHHYVGFLGSGRTFRHELDPEYKAKRPSSTQSYLTWGGVIKAHLRDKWGFVPVKDLEADDAVAIMQYHLGFENSTIAHNDKDLGQVPGNHFNIASKKREYVEELEAYRRLCMQYITGDPTDNVKGIKGKGKVFAEKLLDGAESRIEMLRRVIKAYTQFSTKEEMVKNFRLLKLCTIPKHGFVIPELLPWGTTGVVEKKEEDKKSIEDIFAGWNNE